MSKNCVSVFTGSGWKMPQWHPKWNAIKHLYTDWHFKSKWAKCFLYRWGLGENVEEIRLIFLIFLKHIGKKSLVPLWTCPLCSSNLIVRRKTSFLELKFWVVHILQHISGYHFHLFITLQHHASVEIFAGIELIVCYVLVLTAFPLLANENIDSTLL